MVGLRKSIFVHFSLLMCVSVAVGRAAMLSFGVAQSICIQQRRFTANANGILQGPLTAPLTRRRFDDCLWLSWDTNCRRIVGGKEVVPHSHPSYVRLMKDDGFGLTQNGGATIVNQNWVVTTKHSIQEQGFDYFILVGRHYYNVTEEGEQTVRVDRWILHPDQPGVDGKPVLFDLALLHLERPLEFTEKIQPAALPTRDYTSGDLTLVGTGHTENQNKVTNEIRQVDVPIISLERCRVLAGPKEPINDWELCLYNDNENVLTAGCFGDSGGPAYLIENAQTKKMKNTQHVLVGVIAYSIGKCVNPPRITGLVPIFPNLPWIHQNMKELD